MKVLLTSRTLALFLMLGFVSVVGFISFSYVHASTGVYQCNFHVRYDCSSTGCDKAQGPLSVFIMLDFSNKRYSRCDSKGCDVYSFERNRSGIYTYLNLPGKAMFAKLNDLTMDFMEANSLMDVALVGFGKCKKK